MDAYSAYMQGNQEGRSHLIGPSGVSKCYRQHAYRYMGVEPTDEVSTAKADLGTLFHLGHLFPLSRPPSLPFSPFFPSCIFPHPFPAFSPRTPFTSFLSLPCFHLSVFIFFFPHFPLLSQPLSLLSLIFPFSTFPFVPLSFFSYLFSQSLPILLFSSFSSFNFFLFSFIVFIAIYLIISSFLVPSFTLPASL